MNELLGYQNRIGLARLSWKEGDLVAFGNYSSNNTIPLILGVVERMEKGFVDFQNGVTSSALNLSYRTGGVGGASSFTDEEWTIYTRGNMLALGRPFVLDGVTFANQRPFREAHPSPRPYLAQFAAAGEENVINFLRNNVDLAEMQPYATLIEEGRLVTERNRGEKLVEVIGLGRWLKSLPRFK